MDGCSESGHGVSGCERRGCIEADDWLGLPLKGTAKKRKTESLINLIACKMHNHLALLNMFFFNFDIVISYTATVFIPCLGISFL